MLVGARPPRAKARKRRPRLRRRILRGDLERRVKKQGYNGASADVAELVDAHGSGPCGLRLVEGQVLSSAWPRRGGFPPRPGRGASGPGALLWTVSRLGRLPN